jgi:hypothetical protein
MDGARAHGTMTGTTTPLYVVCSPSRCVGKTLVSRLLTEFYALIDRPVAAFDLADEGPQLADFLPNLTTVADIGDVSGQMAFFDRLIDEHDGVKVIDVSHRVFNNFCTVVREIGFCEEARRRSIALRILFIAAPDATSPKSAEATAMFHRAFAQGSLLPVYNQIAMGELPQLQVPPAGVALDVPLIGFSLRALIDRPAFSFSEFLQAPTPTLPDMLREELQDWITGVFSQFRELDRPVTDGEAPARVPAPRARRASPPRQNSEICPTDRAAAALCLAGPQLANPQLADVPEQVRKFAPKKMRYADGNAMDRSGEAIVAKLQAAAGQLRAAEDRIGQLETEIEQVQDRNVRAETWLDLIRREIEEKLITPAAAGRVKSMGG